MALYFYQALSKEGKKVTGYLDANNIQAAKDQLAKTGIFPIKIELSQQKVTNKSFFSKIFQRKISLKDKLFFTRQLSILLKSGIPLLNALELLVDQTEGSLKNIVVEIKDNIKEGQSLADSLQRYPKTFDNIYIQLVHAGEATGKLELILERLTRYLERQEEVNKKVGGALRYPLIQLAIIFLVVSVLLGFVVPTIASAFTEFSMKLPLPTRILIALSDFFLNYYWLVAIFVIAIVIIYKWWSKTTAGAYIIDKTKLKLPLIGYFAKTNAIVQFSSTLGMLLESGVNLAEALNIVVKIIDNKVLANALEKAKDNIIKQGKISHYLKETGLFPPVAIYLINTGEQSGELDTMLLSVAKYTEDDLRENADALTTLLTPIMLVVMALIVGFVILSIMMPIQNMTQMGAQLVNK